MLHELIRTWFEWVEQWGYLGVFLLMAMESSIIPVPSELVLPPAAFWAAQGRMDFWGVIAAGTLGSYLGSAVSYWLSRWIGHPLLQRYGKFVMITPKKLKMTEAWICLYGSWGVFVARFLPVVRHLISIPAGVFYLPFGRFSLATISGAGLWCWILSWVGAKILGDSPELLHSPETMVEMIRVKMHWFMACALLFAASYGIVVWFKSKRVHLE